MVGRQCSQDVLCRGLSCIQAVHTAQQCWQREVPSRRGTDCPLALKLGAQLSQCSAARHTWEMTRMGKPSEKAVSLSGAHLASVDRLVAPAGLEPNSALPAAPEQAQVHE